IIGNSLIPTHKLLEKIPLVYNVSDKPLNQAESNYLYDFRILREVVLNPGQTREISTRTIKGFTGYLVSVYQKQNYAGISVRVQQDAIKEAKLKDDILPIEVVEITVSNVRSTFYDVERNEREQGYLLSSVFQEWSPVEVGEVINKKKLDDFINLLNLNPDRYISATVSKGDKPGALAVGYDIYEINPWHYFAQIDNSGTKDRQWTPRLGLINTNLTGRDDRLTAIVQGPVDENPEHNYSIYGSYDFPLWTPRLRLKLFGGRSEFDVDGGGGIDFLGNGYFYGGELRFNAFQEKGWFFDLTSSLSREKSKVTTSLFPEFFGSKVYMNLWSVGFDIHRRNDMSNTAFVFNRVQSIDGTGDQKQFWDPGTTTGARTNTDRNFVILTFTANHSQFLDSSKVQRFLGSFKYIRPNERLVPSKMTTFGGMYTVRGYRESKIVADGGLLASLQYEYDLVKESEVEKTESGEPKERKPWLKKLAPLAFFDCGRAKMEDAVPGEKKAEELSSVGLGMIVEVGENFNAGIYYGFPLRSTADTHRGEGRLNIGLMMRW
ncbi:MAG: ShlB/FhaC/HecB family hemolysin secretion/activation protein, partial [Planctomycetota bacterium]